jgi:hypothetical protein
VDEIARLKNQWVSTVEGHRWPNVNAGWPHVNFVLWSPELAAWIAQEKTEKMSDGLTEEASLFVSRELADIVTAAGWGLMSTAERAESRDAALGYLTTLAAKADETIGELSKRSQLPTNAPFRFRRLRSGKCFLAPRVKNPATTGTLVRRQNSNDGTRDVLPLHNITRPETIPIAEYCCANEERIWYDELEAAERCKRQVKQFGLSAVELPPVTHWHRFVRLPTTTRGTHANDYLPRSTEVLSQTGTRRRSDPDPELSGSESSGSVLRGRVDASGRRCPDVARVLGRGPPSVRRRWTSNGVLAQAEQTQLRFLVG